MFQSIKVLYACCSRTKGRRCFVVWVGFFQFAFLEVVMFP